MKVGTNPATELKVESEKQNRPFSDVLHQYVEENLLKRIYESKYKEDIWIKDDLPWNTECEKIHLFYRNRTNDLLDVSRAQLIMQSLFANKDEVQWQYKVRGDEEFTVALVAEYKGMEVPVTIIMEELCDSTAVADKCSFRPMLRHVVQITCLVYSPQTVVVDSIYEIIEKLELIGDMEPYAVINKTLKTSSVSGRHIIEGLSEKTANYPKVLKEKRISQIESYRNYTYMKKRWDKYCKIHTDSQDNWDEVVDRIVRFLAPIWQALCRNEIFFDDWMPELGRYLG